MKRDGSIRHGIGRCVALVAMAMSLSMAPWTMAGDGQGHTASPYDAARFVSHKISDKLYMLEAAELGPRHVAGNMAVLIGDDGVLIVDDQFVEMSDRIRAEIAKLSDKPIKYIVNTHAHKDHANGNPAFGHNHGGVIVAHKLARESLVNSHDILVKALGKTVHIPAMDPAGWPQITLEDSLEIHFNGETVRVLYLGAGHTNADVVVQFVESNVIHMGDAYVQYGLPWIDLYRGGDARGLVNAYAVASTISNDETVVIPGHGQIASRKTLLANGKALETIVDRVQEGIDAGSTLAEIQASKPARDYGNQGIVSDDYFVELVYESLNKQQSDNPDKPK